MSEETKSILKRANAAMVEGDYEAFLSHCTEDVEWVFIGEQTLSGKEAVRQYIAETYTEPPRFTVERMTAEGDTVVAMGDITLKDAAGRDVHSAYCDVWRVRDGKLAELKAFVVETRAGD